MRRWRFWAWPGRLRERGILGMNGRNAQYILPGNPRRYYPLVDDKLVTKRICEGRGIPVPRTYGVIARHGDVGRLFHLTAQHSEFVIKPSRGSEGRGIKVIADRRNGLLVTSGGETLSLADLDYHVADVLAGLYSLGGQADLITLVRRKEGLRQISTNRLA